MPNDISSYKGAVADLALAPLNLTVLLAPYSATAAATLESPTTGELLIPSQYQSVGHFQKAAGLTITTDMESQDIEAYGEADPIRTIISRRKTSFNFSMYQNQRNVLELVWATDFSSVTPSQFGGVVLQAPVKPQNKLYRAVIVGQDDRDGDPIWVYWLMPKVKLENVDSQTLNDDGVIEYSPTLVAFKDDVLGYSVAQGFAGPGWRDIVDEAGFKAAPTSISVTPASPIALTVAAGAGKTSQLVVTGNNGIDLTANCFYQVTGTGNRVTVSQGGLITAGSTAGTGTTVTVTYGSLTPVVVATNVT
jgi:hypothetical protein